MPYIHEDLTLDTYSGEITKCDRCGKIEKTMEATLDIVSYWHHVFFKRHKPEFGVFCYECAKAVTPLVYQLRDVDELTMYVNKLERAINESRKNRNHRTTAHDAGECGKGCAQRRFGHRPGDCFAQAGEEHF